MESAFFFRCDLCPAFMAHPLAFEGHMTKFHSMFKEDFRRSYNESSKVKVFFHVKDENNNEVNRVTEKPFQCANCDRRFRTLSYREVHLEKHCPGTQRAKRQCIRVEQERKQSSAKALNAQGTNKKDLESRHRCLLLVCFIKISKIR